MIGLLLLIFFYIFVFKNFFLFFSVVCHAVLGVLLCLFQTSNTSDILPCALSEQASLSESILSFLENTNWSDGIAQDSSKQTNQWLPLLPLLVAQTRALLEVRLFS
jgi:hypothetical protein